MSNRITEKDLEVVCEVLNDLTGSPMESYTRDVDGRLRANIGNFHISHAYGGVQLNRMSNEGGGITCPIGLGHVPKRELYYRICSMIEGLRLAKQDNGNA